ncbi:hypothetical protein [Emticicia fontis]
MKIIFLFKKLGFVFLEAFTNPNNYIFSGVLVILQVCLKCLAQFVLSFVEAYIFSDWSYAVSLSVAVFLDTFLAIYLSLTNKPRTFDFKVLYKGLLDKIVIYPIIIAGLHLITKAKFDQVHFTFLDFVYIVGSGVLLSYEVGSILTKARTKFPFVAVIIEKFNFGRKKFLEDAQETPIK